MDPFNVVHQMGGVALPPTCTSKRSDANGVALFIQKVCVVMGWCFASMKGIAGRCCATTYTCIQEVWCQVVASKSCVEADKMQGNIWRCWWLCWNILENNQPTGVRLEKNVRRHCCTTRGASIIGSCVAGNLGTSRKLRLLQCSGAWHHDVIKNKVKEPPDRQMRCATFQRKKKHLETHCVAVLEKVTWWCDKKCNKGTSRKGHQLCCFLEKKGNIQKVVGVAALWKVAMPWHDTKCSSQCHGMQLPMLQQHAMQSPMPRHNTCQCCDTKTHGLKKNAQHAMQQYKKWQSKMSLPNLGTNHNATAPRAMWQHEKMAKGWWHWQCQTTTTHVDCCMLWVQKKLAMVVMSFHQKK